MEPGDVAHRVRQVRVVPSSGWDGLSDADLPGRPAARNEIKDAVLSRRMPPWGAVKGFGSFRNDQSLSQEQIETRDAMGGWWHQAGQQPADVAHHAGATPAPVSRRNAVVTVQGTARLSGPCSSTGWCRRRCRRGGSLRVTAVLPDGRVEPLVWLHDYDDRYRHPFLFRRPILLPEGNDDSGLASDAALGLMSR